MKNLMKNLLLWSFLIFLVGCHGSLVVESKHADHSHASLEQAIQIQTSIQAAHDAEHTSPRSPEWPKVRAAFLKDHSTCAACGGMDHLEVHHILPFHLYPEKELDPTNFITLCTHPSHNCHFFLGHACDWKAYNPDVVKEAELCLQCIRNRKYDVESKVLLETK